MFFVLEGLPQRFAQHYTVRFVHRFLAATVIIIGRLAQDLRTNDMRVDSWFEQSEHSEGYFHTYVTDVEAPAIGKDEDQPYEQDPPTA